MAWLSIHPDKERGALGTGLAFAGMNRTWRNRYLNQNGTSSRPGYPLLYAKSARKDACQNQGTGHKPRGSVAAPNLSWRFGRGLDYVQIATLKIGGDIHRW